MPNTRDAATIRQVIEDVVKCPSCLAPLNETNAVAVVFDDGIARGPAIIDACCTTCHDAHPWRPHDQRERVIRPARHEPPRTVDGYNVEFLGAKPPRCGEDY